MFVKTEKKDPISTYIPPWMIIGSVLILLGVVLIFAMRNIDREKGHMSRILTEKGGAIIRAFEAGSRTGMMHMRWGSDQIRSLLEATANQPGILYLMVTDHKGRILAHSRTDMVGKVYLDRQTMESLDPGSTSRWRLTTFGGKNAFEVYRFFRPWKGADKTAASMAMSAMCGPGGKEAHENAWCLPSTRPGEEKVIFVGLDMEPFEAARDEDTRNTIITSMILLIVGLGGLFSMFLVHRYRTTSRMLRDTSALANEVVGSLPVGLVVMGKNGRIAFMNRAAKKITGTGLRGAVDRSPEEVLPPAISNMVYELLHDNPLVEREVECIFSGNDPTFLHVTGSRIVNGEGGIVAVTLILRDLTEVRRLQEEVKRREKLAALGSLAAGIAHEIRNPLSSLKGLATYFRGKFPEGSEDKEAAGIMISEVDRLNLVISELLEFARPSELAPKPTDINELLEHSLRLVRQDAEARGIAISLSKDDSLPQALVDPDRFTQCLLNLCLNGIQAMEEGGTLSVRCAAGPERTIKVSVTDTGSGIEGDDMDKIFDPYFTTKPTGTGLGLAIVHKIVEAHNGRIELRSSPGQGTVFTISIPAAEGPRQASSPS